MWSACKGEVELKSKEKRRERIRLRQVDGGWGMRLDQIKRDRKSLRGSECLQSGTCFNFLKNRIICCDQEVRLDGWTWKKNIFFTFIARIFS